MLAKHLTRKLKREKEWERKRVCERESGSSVRWRGKEHARERERVSVSCELNKSFDLWRSNSIATPSIR